ncbi:enoyl-CoA hydratase/isomerase family protein [Microbacterium sp. zg-Y818]|uniref:enoyl-CoA hydratase/isomerase family protein n=1 Tax=unclassified Microbacterium TaxID=2609290 RepID=UPI00214B70D6|nr:MULTISPECIES: enoyl-CoA hydratase/isomerase family protein [unclassified Microbacterium]MCR2799386.1 enoyl-CoA hydratase/isomerase family protein [Microbacterium sp. zg.Y818]WIM21385.1 enoyl-CoA hydratase/isomerase family protein [Microbacterium sp. zg-Y818]
MSGSIRVDSGGVICRITISSRRRNALDAAMWADLADAVRRADADAAVRVILVTGDGEDFSTGVDLAAAWAAGQRVDPSVLTTQAESALMNTRTPTIAVIRGLCIGGGAMIAGACDFRIASHTASVAVTPAKFGVIYPATSVRRLARLVGPSVAKRMLVAAEAFCAADALAAGFLDALHADDEVDAEAESFAQRLADLAPLSQAAAKEFIDGLGPDGETAIAATERWEAIARADPEQHDRVRAFLDRNRA